MVKIIRNSVVDLPSPLSISTWWNLGFILGFTLLSQLSTGLFLSIHFINYSNISFDSVIYIIRNVNMGWTVRFMHTTGATVIFMLLFIHLGRGMFFSSIHTKKATWITGVLLLILTIARAFLGYVLPWGQISFWGATVITNTFSAIPYIGNSVVQWAWGNFSVSQPTLRRFFSLHFVVPLFIVLLAVLHLIILHSTGSSNPTGSHENIEKVKFFPSIIYKDLMMGTVLFFLIFTAVLLVPIATIDVENYNLANPLRSPVHIQPEWYFLFAYAILRSVPSKLGGVVCLALSILILLVTNKKPGRKKFSPTRKTYIWLTVTAILLLTWIGAKPVESPLVEIGQFVRTLYFTLILTH